MSIVKAVCDWLSGIVLPSKIDTVSSIYAEIMENDYNINHEDTISFDAIPIGIGSINNPNWLKWFICNNISNKEGGILNFTSIQYDTDTKETSILEPKSVGVYLEDSNMCLYLDGKTTVNSNLLSTILLGEYLVQFMYFITASGVKSYALTRDGDMYELFEVIDKEKVKYLTSGLTRRPIKSSSFKLEDGHYKLQICL